MKNSGIETIKHKGKEVNVMDQLKKTKRETGSSDMGFDKYKMWMTTPVEGLTKTNVNTKYFQKSSSRCGEEGGITGPFTSETRYTGDANIEEGKPNVINPNGFMLLLNLNNNSYSFTCDFVMPKGFFFNGDTHESGTCSQPDKLIKTTARTFMENNKKKEGLIYKNPLPDTGMVLSGSEIITDKFGIGLDKEGANWSVKIDWTISLADR